MPSKPAMLGLAFTTLLLAGASEALGDDSCQVGLDALDDGDDATAFVALESCLEGKPSDEHRVRAKKGLRVVTERLRSGRFAEVSLAIEPADAVVEIDAIKTRVNSQATLFLPMGRHMLRASRAGFVSIETTVVVTNQERQAVVLRLSEPTGTKTGDGTITFDEPEAALPPSRPQTAADFESLIPDKFAKGQPGHGTTRGDRRAPRWPWAIVGAGAALGVAGAISHIRGNERLALALYIGGAVTVGGGALTLALTRPKTPIPPDPELGAQRPSARYWVAYSRSF